MFKWNTKKLVFLVALQIQSNCPKRMSHDFQSTIHHKLPAGDEFLMIYHLLYSQSEYILHSSNLTVNSNRIQRVLWSLPITEKSRINFYYRNE